MNRIAMTNATIRAISPVSISTLRCDGPCCGPDCERRPADGGDDHGRARRDRLVVVGEGQPDLTREPHVTRMELLADLIEGERTLADEPAVYARRQRPLALAPKP